MGRISLGTEPTLPPYHIVVQFGPGIPSDEQGRLMLAMEKNMRNRGIPAEVYKDTIADDSKLRREMTDAQRSRL